MHVKQQVRRYSLTNKKERLLPKQSYSQEASFTEMFSNILVEDQASAAGLVLKQAHAD